LLSDFQSTNIFNFIRRKRPQKNNKKTTTTDRQTGNYDNDDCASAVSNGGPSKQSRVKVT